jgi:hypothetical protein
MGILMPCKITRRTMMGAALASFVPGVAHAADEPLVVIASAKTLLASISRSDLRRLFSGEQVSFGGKPLVPFAASPETRERAFFDKAILGMSPEQMSKYWIDRRIRGQSSAPRSAPKPENIAKAVATVPNAVGYVPASMPLVGIKVIAIDGKRAGDSSYALARKR